MARIALVLDLAFLLLAFGGRTLVQWRRTGDAGWRLGRPHSRAEGVARGLLVGACALLGAGVAWGWEAEPRATAAAGIAAAVAGIAIVVVAQLQMGASWRIGVDPAEHTPLVVTGLYAHVRNPIYTGMVVFALGQLLMLPNPLSALGCAAMLAGVEIQVRAVEEPFLAATHGAPFTAWSTHAGRFLPGVGRGTAREHR
jgi:protein-S-isoprenylcysteine O-methyltransferase Ste14